MVPENTGLPRPGAAAPRLVRESGVHHRAPARAADRSIDGSGAVHAAIPRAQVAVLETSHRPPRTLGELARAVQA